MEQEGTKKYSDRPVEVQYVKFTSSPEYHERQPHDDKLAILVCQIKIWRAKGNNWFDIPKAAECLTIRECESVEVAESAKEVISKAVVRFPRGTVVSLSSRRNDDVQTGNPENATQNTGSLESSTNDGDLMTSQSSTYKDDGVSTTSMAVDYDDKGLLDFNRTEDDVALLSPNDVAVGNRIEIRLGYAYSEWEFEEMNTADSHPYMQLVFTGFITSISVNTPLEIQCENMAHVFSCISAPNIQIKGSMQLKDLLDEGAENWLLRDTGIPLADECKGSTTTVAGGTITDNLTVANVFEAWNSSGLRCVIDTSDDGSARLRVGLAYYAGTGGSAMPSNDKRYITYRRDQLYAILQFDWDVASDKLGMKRNDKKYLAVEAHGKRDNKTFKLTIRKNADVDDEGWMVDEGQFQVVNKQKEKPKKEKKVAGGSSKATPTNRTMTVKQALDRYDVVPYFSLTENVTEEQLIEEAKQYWAKYVPNGISGSIEIFGDIVVRPTDIVGLYDTRNPQKNGYYYVEEVNTSFGVNGFRRELKIPYKVSSFTKKIEVVK